MKYPQAAPGDVQPDETMTGERDLYAEEALEILKRVSDADCENLGLDPRFCRPDWMILTVLPVSPPHVRPAIMTDGGSRGEDDITFKLVCVCLCVCVCLSVCVCLCVCVYA